MPHALPPADSPIRELFEVSQLAAIGLGQEPVPLFGHALMRARKAVREPAVRAIVFFAVAVQNDQLGLYRVGKRGGWKRLWNFGPITRATVLA